LSDLANPLPSAHSPAHAGWATRGLALRISLALAQAYQAEITALHVAPPLATSDKMRRSTT